MRSRAGFLAGVLVVAGLLGGVTASSVAAATKTTVTWKVLSLSAGQVKSLSAVASTNSPGVKTWSKTGSCVLSPKSKPAKLTMGTGNSCTLTLTIAKSGKYPAKMSDQTITRKSTVPTTTTTVPATTTTTVPATTTTTLAPIPLYSVGDPGPGGGTIFYVDITRAVGSQYFEAACASWMSNCDGTTADPTFQWGCELGAFNNAYHIGIGLGEQNTEHIRRGCPSYLGVNAAYVCDVAVIGGQSDWYLPAHDELYEMYVQRTAIGGFWQTGYWSSSRADYESAWMRGFGNGFYNNLPKSWLLYVRPIRSF